MIDNNLGKLGYTYGPNNNQNNKPSDIVKGAGNVVEGKITSALDKTQVALDTVSTVNDDNYQDMLSDLFDFAKSVVN